MSFLFYIMLILSVVCFILYGIMWWAKYWPSVICEIKEMSPAKITIRDSEVYIPQVVYSYSYGGAVQESRNAFLFSGRTFPSEKEAVDYFSVNKAYFCPFNSRWSYLWQDPRVFWGLLSLPIFGFISSPVILLLA